MANSHVKIQNVIVLKRYVASMQFHDNKLHVEYIGGRTEDFTLDYPPTQQEIASYEAELEDRE